MQALAPALPKIAMEGARWPKVKGQTYLLSVGKAATQMAAAIENQLPDDIEGLIVTRQGYSQPGFDPNNISIVEASHPVPDNAGALAAQNLLSAAEKLGEHDLLLVLMSGGASSLLPAPTKNISLMEKQSITKSLLHCGAPISEMNIVRKHLSAVKGGQLAVKAWPARTHMIAISDIPGDDVSMIGSGPTIADSSTCKDALQIVDQYGIAIPKLILDQWQQGILETPKQDDPRMDRSTYEICACAADICEAAAKIAKTNGYEPVLLGDDLEGDAVQLGKEHARLALELKSNGRKAAIISGGEATVTVQNQDGRGGRCTSYLLACSLALKNTRGICGFAADTDGIDGTEDNAGAFFWPGVIDMMGGGQHGQDFLEADNSYVAFDRANALLKTGPSGTNVNDLRVILVDQ